MHRFVSRVLRSPIPISLLLLLLTALGSGCQPVLMEPVDQSSYTGGNIRFWGYTAISGEQLVVQAQNTSAVWEPITIAAAARVPTYTAGSAGYYFEGWVYGPSIPARFRLASPLSSQGYWRTNFRVVSDGTTIANIRQYQANGTNSTSTNWFEEYWFEHKASGTTLRLDIHP